MKNVTITDIAKAANVSIATISRVINNKPGVSTMLKSKIVRLIKEMDYSVDSCGAPNVIGIVCGSLQINIGRYLALMLNQLYREVNSRGYRTIIVSYDDISLFDESILCGVISIDFFQRISSKWANIKNLPMVCVYDCGYHQENIYSVNPDRCKAMYDMVKHLVDLKHHRIGFIQYFESKQDSKNINYDKNSFIEAASHFQIENSVHVETFRNDASIHDAIGKLLLKGITALIVKGESFTPRVRYSLELYQKRIPDDISVITNDDDYSCDFFIPGQTAMAYDYPEISRQAVNMLESLIAGEKVSDTKVEFKFIERGSTALWQN